MGLGASLAQSRAEGSSGLPTLRQATSLLGDTGGLSPILSWQPFQHTKPGVDTGAVVFHAAVKLPELFFQPGDTKANPGTLTEVPFNQQKTAGKMKVLP